MIKMQCLHILKNDWWMDLLFSLCVYVFFLHSGIAKHFRYGSQEDAHEFLRYTVDAMQKSCLPATK